MKDCFIKSKICVKHGQVEPCYRCPQERDEDEALRKRLIFHYPKNIEMCHGCHSELVVTINGGLVTSRVIIKCDRQENSHGERWLVGFGSKEQWNIYLSEQV